jgi:thymidylate kinase
VIRPAIEADAIVVCDRFMTPASPTRVARGLGAERVEELCDLATRAWVLT